MRALHLAIDRPLGGVESVFSALAAVIMASVMGIVTFDVAMRYVFNRPLGWSYDLIDLYLSVFLFYLMLSFTFARHGHIRVDIVQQYLGVRARAAFEVVTCVTAFLVFFSIAIVAAGRCWTQWDGGDVVQGDVDWPSWLSTFAVPLGSFTLSLRLLVNGLSSLLAMFGGDPAIPLPPLHTEVSREARVTVE